MHVDDVRAESFPRNLERQQRSGAVFEKGVHLGETGQPIIMLGRLPVDRHPMLRLIQQEADFPWLKIFHAQQMPVRKIVATGKPGLAHSGLHGCGLLQRSEEHTSELQSLMRISYAVFCLKKKKQT